MKITRKQIKKLGCLLNSSLKNFDNTYWSFYFKRSKSNRYHEFMFIDYLKSEIDKIQITRGATNKYYLKYSDLHLKLLKHIHYDLRMYRANFPLRIPDVDLSHIDFTYCDFKEIELPHDEFMDKLNSIVNSKKEF